jgi:hypothetical protein
MKNCLGLLVDRARKELGYRRHYAVFEGLK